MNGTRNIFMKREIYRSFDKKNSLLTAEKRRTCCSFFLSLDCSFYPKIKVAINKFVVCS